MGVTPYVKVTVLLSVKGMGHPPLLTSDIEQALLLGKKLLRQTLSPTTKVT